MKLKQTSITTSKVNELYNIKSYLLKVNTMILNHGLNIVHNFEFKFWIKD